MRFTRLFAALLFASIASNVAASPAVRLTTIEGESIDGHWAGISSTGGITVGDGSKTRTYAPADLMLLRWNDAASTRPASQPAATELHLADGSRIFARIVGSDGRNLELDAGLPARLHVSLNNLAAVRFGSPNNAALLEAFRNAMAHRDSSQDLLLTWRDNRVALLRGVVEALTAEGGTFRWRERPIPIQTNSDCALIFAVGVHSPAAGTALCILRDGSAWAGRLAGSEGADQIIIELSGGDSLRLPVTKLSEIRFRSDRVLFLSDLEPGSYEFHPMGAATWPYRKDRSVANRPMRIGSQSFDRGIGMHSQAALTYQLTDRFASLAATIGIDEAVGPIGNAVFRVLADDKEVFNSGPVTGRDEPRAILVPISGAKKIKLVVDCGEELDVGDQADWANIRLIK